MEIAAVCQPIVDHRLCGCLKLRKSRLDLTTLEVRPESRDRNVDGRAYRRELKLYPWAPQK
jgi:hypothetical protein